MSSAAPINGPAAAQAGLAPGCELPASCLDIDLAWSLPLAARAFAQLAGAALARLPGGPRGYLVLATIARGLPRSQLALAHRLGVDKTAMTYLLDELEAACLIERHPDPADRRARQVVITDRGVQALCSSSEQLRAAEDKLLAPLCGSDAASLRAMLEKVARSAPGAREPGPCSPAAAVGPADDSDR